MQRDVPSAPDLLERAVRAEPAALSALVCARKERAYQLALSLSMSGLDSELSSDLSASMEELADSCAYGRALRRHAERAVEAGATPSSGTFTLGEAERGEGRAARFMQQALLHRWQLVYALCRALPALVHQERAVLVLIDMEGLETDQVAWLLGIREAEVRERLLSARSALRAALLAQDNQQHGPRARRRPSRLGGSVA
jgi:DNA-directed RNA polymerase specialized sigma24 family protein